MESDPLMSNKRKGRDTGGDAVKAIKAQALIDAGLIDEDSASDFDTLDATLDFVDTVFDSELLGMDMSEQLKGLKGKSADEMKAKNQFTSTLNRQVEQGVTTADSASLVASNSADFSAEQFIEQALENSDLISRVDQGLSVEDAMKEATNAATASGSPELKALLDELKKLQLSPEELAKVLEDLDAGPQASAPSSPPSMVTPLALENEFKMINLLQDLKLDGTLDLTLLMAADEALASVFFQDLASTYEALSTLDSSVSSDSSNDTSSSDNKELVLGAKTISINNGIYSLGETNSDYLIAASETLTLLGNVVFNTSSSDSSLILLSAENIDLSGTSSISFSGNELGIGSFDSLNVENVSLKAEGILSLRSLDSIVLNNSKMETSGKGADFIHLLAANTITANSLQFSEQIKQITMEAMTINLSNINFPSSSMVNLNSLYGGFDGKYPGFGSIQYGRVNFIQNIQYGSNAILDRSSFDLHGGNITIGTSGL
jgi:hypothetical protein